MASHFRSRGYDSGTVIYQPTGQVFDHTQPAGSDHVQICAHGPRTIDNPFGVVHQWNNERHVPFIDGLFQLVDYPVGLDQFPGLKLLDSDPSSYLSRILAQTGPITPKLSLPLALFELREIPDMLRHAGNLLLKIRQPSNLRPDAEAASAVLAYQFGWGPLLQDVGKMLNFADLVRKKQVELKAANSRRGLKRRISLDEQSDTVSGSSYVVSSWGHLINAQYVDVRSLKLWATVRWHLRDETQLGSDPEWIDSMKVALGLNRGQLPIYVWKSIPWTWAVDWFADISNILQANYNMIYYKPSNVNFMASSEATRTYSSPPFLVQAGAQTFSDLKSRVVYPHPAPNVSLRIPFLDTFKLSILSSLTIVGLRGRR